MLANSSSISPRLAMSQPGRLPVRLLLASLLVIPGGCRDLPSGASPVDEAGVDRVHPDSLGPWQLPPGDAGRTPEAFRLESLGVRPQRFEPIRARYLQTIYDAPRQLGSRLLVTIQIDRAVQSGAWDGTYPAEIPGLREPGLVVDWQIQNSIYNAFDRVLTDENLGMRQRVMPGGSSVAGLVMGAVRDGIHSRIVADPTAPADAPGGTDEAVTRFQLPGGTVNVLTAPLVLSQMELDAGDVFSLPGYALIGGPDGVGTPWVGLYEVLSVGREPRADGRRVVELVTARRPEGWSGPSDIRTREGRITRVVVTNTPPYLLAREDYLIHGDGSLSPVREHLHLVDWAPLPLPGADLVADSLWRIDLEGELFDLEPSLLPMIVAPGS